MRFDHLAFESPVRVICGARTTAHGLEFAITNIRGRDRRKVPDMSAVPQEITWVYEPPPVAQCRVEDIPIDLDNRNRIHYRAAYYRGKVVDFCVIQLTRTNAGAPWSQVTRIDSNHGTIHRHEIVPGDEPGSRKTIAEIPRKDSWDFVDRHFTTSYDMLLNDWQVNLERWSR